jgi:hypothetical protein
MVQSTADVFRDVVSAMRSLNGRDGVNFHTFKLLADPCVRLLVKNLGRCIPKSIQREELETQNNCVQGVMQLRCGRRDQDPDREHLPAPFYCFEGAWALNVEGASLH